VLVWGPLNDFDFTPGEVVTSDWLFICDSIATECVAAQSPTGWIWSPDNTLGLESGQPVGSGDTVAQANGFNGLSDVDICTLLSDQCISTIATTTINHLAPLFSVVRTGTGNLDMLAAGDFKMMSLYGVYTAGTQSMLPGGSAANDQFNRPRGNGLSGQTIEGSSGLDYSASLATYQAYYPDHGGNVLISTGGDVIGDLSRTSDSVGNWLWRQGSGTALSGQDSIPTAWWINFGTYGLTPGALATSDQPAVVVGFTGIGALGGGNVSILAGGNAGIIDPRGNALAGGTANPRSQGLDVAVGSTGRVGPDGQLTLTGGGDINIRIGGALNPNALATQDDSATTAQAVQNPDLNGTLVNLRGTVSVVTSAIGGIDRAYPTPAGTNTDPKDTRAIDPFTPSVAQALGGIGLMLGDSTAYLDTRGDLVLGGAGDPGRTLVVNTQPFTFNGQPFQGGQSWFSLWTDHTAINLFSAGGNLTPINLIDQRSINSASDYAPTDNAFVYPSILRAVAASGSIYYGPSDKFDARTTNPNANISLWLAPSPSGELDFLAANSIYAGGYAIDMSGSDTPLPTPLNPAFMGHNGPDNRFNVVVSNTSNEGISTTGPSQYPLFAFGPNTPVNGGLHDDPNDPIRFYAVGGDIVGLRTGEILSFVGSTNEFTTWYLGGAPVNIRAGRDIVNTGTQPGTSTASPVAGVPSTGNIIVQDDPNAVSIVSAGRDIIFANFQIAGPGTLEVSAGRNILQQDKGSITSIGSIVRGDTRPGASILMQAGGGANGPDYSDFAKLYLDPANLADPTKALADQPGKVAKNYDGELITWLKDRYGFTGTTEEALAYFNGLAPEQQGIFLRQIYFAELTAGGREFNDPDSTRFNNYIRGREAIAALFPDTDTNGNAITRGGDITMFGGSGVRTLAGGDIQMLAPGGQIVIGVEGEVPPATSGVITQGTTESPGNIQIYSQGSVLLGLSRIMTTLGGDIIAWSEEGDINAGRGSKTSILYTPPQRRYDIYGNVALSPNAPASGAGISARSVLAGVPSGNVDLIAPLGTIDIGEAGVSGNNVNLAALHIVNVANVSAQGTVTGTPTIQAPNIGGLTEASNTAGAAAQQAMTPGRGSGNAQPSIIIVEVLGFGGGDGETSPQPGGKPRRSGEQRTYNQNGNVQVLGYSTLADSEMTGLTEAEKQAIRN
jgi:hypothetical protein